MLVCRPGLHLLFRPFNSENIVVDFPTVCFNEIFLISAIVVFYTFSS